MRAIIRNGKFEQSCQSDEFALHLRRQFEIYMCVQLEINLLGIKVENTVTSVAEAHIVHCKQA